MDGSLEVGSLVAFQSLLGSFSAPVAELVGFTWLVQHLQNVIRSLDDVFDEPVDPACDPEVQTLEFSGGAPRLQGALEIRVDASRRKGSKARRRAKTRPSAPARP